MREPRLVKEEEVVESAGEEVEELAANGQRHKDLDELASNVRVGPGGGEKQVKGVRLHQLRDEVHLLPRPAPPFCAVTPSQKQKKQKTAPRS